MFVVDRSNFLLLLFINIIIRYSAVISPHGNRKEVNEAFISRIRSLNLDSDDEDNTNNYRSASVVLSTGMNQSPSSTDERRDIGGKILRNSPFYRRPNRFTLSESDSDDELNLLRDQFESDSSSNYQSDRNIVDFESSFEQKVPGDTPIFDDSSSKTDFASSPHSFNEFLSPVSNGPLGSAPVASLNELYHTPMGGFNLNKNLWEEEDRRYIKIAKPPLAPGSHSISIMSVKGLEIPKEFLKAVDFGQQINNEALSNMKWKKTFISGNSANVFGVELNNKSLILKITKHQYDEKIPQCVHKNDVKSLHQSNNSCGHKPKYGFIQKSECSADPDLVPFEYYIAEKIALTHGLMPAAASIPNTFAKDNTQWYLLFEELTGISPLKYGENILERLAKPLIRQQLEALKQIANCHIMHLDAHWGNVLYSRERGIQFIDFGLATLVDRFELTNHKAALIITFTFDRCLDCAASQLGRDFEKFIKTNYPIDGQAILSHPWLQYESK